MAAPSPPPAIGSAGALFNAQAAAYAEFRPTYPPRLYEAITAFERGGGVPPPQPRIAVDVATGSGQAARDLAGRYTAVIGLDASAAQVAAAPRDNPEITYRVGTAEATGLPPCSAALVTAAQALHWFDASAFYAEAARILAPGGTVAVWGYTMAVLPDTPGGNAALQALFSDPPLGPLWDARRRILDGEYAGLDPPGALFTRVTRIVGRGAPVSVGDEPSGPSMSTADGITLQYDPNLRITGTMDRAQLEGYVRSWSAHATYCKQQRQQFRRNCNLDDDAPSAAPSRSIATGVPTDDTRYAADAEDPATALGLAVGAALHREGRGVPSGDWRVRVEWPIVLLLGERKSG